MSITMNRLIILEGPDECGKTTLGLQLARYFNGVYIHATASKSLFSALPDYHNSLLEIAQANLELGKDVIMDRFWPSEHCYGPLFRCNSGYSEHGWKLHERIIKLNHIYIFCMAYSAWGRYEKGHIDPAHSVLSKKQYMEVWGNYITLSSELLKLGSTVAHYNLDFDGMEENVPTFLAYVKQLTS